MTIGVSGRSLATSLGVSETAVRKAVRAKRIPQHGDGSYDVEQCRQAWGKSTDPARSKVREPANPGARTPMVRTEDDAKAAIALIAQVLQAEGAEAGTIDYNAARTADTILKAYERDLSMAQKRKDLVPATDTKRHFSSAFTGFRQQIQRMPSRHVPEMAARLGVDPGLLQSEMDRMVAATLTEMSAR